MMPSSYMSRTLLIPMIPSSLLMKFRNHRKFITRIREFTRQFKAHFIVTGSYLGRIYDPEFRYSSGDVTKLTIYTLSFEEFLMAYDQNLYGDYKKISLVSSEAEVYNRLKETYELYCQIGGYPKVVETIWKTGTS